MSLNAQIFSRISSEFAKKDTELEEACKAIEAWCKSAATGEYISYELTSTLIHAKLTPDNLEVTVGRAQGISAGSNTSPSPSFEKYKFPV